MQCPFCDGRDTKVWDTRHMDDGTIKRRRECLDCRGKFVTFERVGLRTIKVLKKNGGTRLFDGNKVIHSMEMACRNRPIVYDQLERALTSVIKQLEKVTDPAIPSTVIGQLVMDELLKIDKVAYIRYASVYKSFKSVEDFEKLLKNLVDLRDKDE